MTILAVALFGSRARGDHQEESDTDLLLVTDEAAPRTSQFGTIALSIYPEAKLLELAAQGDLFTGHLVLDARPLYDPDGFLARLRHAWRPRKDYSVEIAHASDLAALLLSYGETLASPNVVNRRISWCVRTILIARSAEAGNVRYAATALAHFAEDESVARLIALKSEAALVPDVIPAFIRLVRRWGIPTPLRRPEISVADFAAHFRLTGNNLGLKTLGVKPTLAVSPEYE